MNLPAGLSTLQHTDRWIGVPACAFLTCLRKLAGQRKHILPAPKRILFIKCAEQGSTVLAYPALLRATEMVGAKNVYVMVFEDNRFILDAMEIIPEENVITIRTTSALALTVSALRAIGRARRLRIDAAIDLEFLTRFSAILTFLSGAKRRVGFHTFFSDGPYRGDLMTHRLLYNSHLHTSELFDVMVEALMHDPRTLPTLGFKPPTNLRFPKFTPRPGERAEVDALLERENPALTSAPIVLLNPNAGDLLPLRRWPPQRYVELARELLRRHPELFIAFTGSPSEAAEVNQLAREVGSPRVVGLAGKTTLRQMLVLYTRCEILITNDSGPAHFASMTPINVVTLFGPEAPALFAARSPNASVLWAGVACSPCVNAYNNRQTVCRNNLCMQAITVEQVLKHVSQIYHTRMTARPVPRFDPATLIPTP